MRISSYLPTLFLHSLLGCLAASTAGCEDEDSDAMDASSSLATMTTTSVASGTETSQTTSTSSQTASTTSESGSTSTDETTQAGCSVVPPTVWSAPAWAAHTTTALALRTQLDTLVGSELMRGVEEGTVALDDLNALQEAFVSGAPSLQSITTLAYSPVVADAFAQFGELVAAGPLDLVSDEILWSPGPHGGIFGEKKRGINEGGIEVRQVVDKGLFAGAAFYPYALSLTQGEITEATIDSLAALWGANSTLDPMGELTDSAGYSYQMGFHARIGTSLIAAKAYATDLECVTQRDQALRDFFAAWELSMQARMIFYANRALTGVAAATSDTEFAEALHGLAEGLALSWGFYGLTSPTSGPLQTNARIIGDEDTAAILAAFGANLDSLGSATTGKLIESVPNFEMAVATAEAIIARAYNLQVTDLAAFRMPTAG